MICCPLGRNAPGTLSARARFSTITSAPLGLRLPAAGGREFQVSVLLASFSPPLELSFLFFHKCQHQHRGVFRRGC